MKKTREIELISGGLVVDDRGVLRFANDFCFNNVKQFFQTENHHVGFIRAWHGHTREGRYLWVAHGSVLVGAVPLYVETGDISKVQKYILTDLSPSILWIPEGYYSGFKTLKEDTILMVFTTLTSDEAKGEANRLPYDTWNIWGEEYR